MGQVHNMVLARGNKQVQGHSRLAQGHNSSVQGPHKDPGSRQIVS